MGNYVTDTVGAPEDAIIRYSGDNLLRGCFYGASEVLSNTQAIVLKPLTKPIRNHCLEHNGARE